jgi:hypothetical protein
MQLSMSETSPKSDLLLAILTHLFCLLMGLAAVGVCGWVVATRQLFTLDGLVLVAVSGAIATFFVGNTAWAAYTGELRGLLALMRSKSEAPAPEPPPEKP